MSSHQVFFHIQDPTLCDNILSNIMSLEVMIPSLVTFHSNMRYFSIGTRVLQDFIADSSRFETTFQSLFRQWAYDPVFEVSEGNFALMDLTTVDLAYIQLFLFVLRHFPLLSEDRPVQDKQGEYARAGVDSNCVDQLYYRALRLEFRTLKARSHTFHDLECNESNHLPLDLEVRCIDIIWSITLQTLNIHFYALPFQVYFVVNAICMSEKDMEPVAAPVSTHIFVVDL
ncbi:hypothetical protein QC764_0041880 [Podospora pseudoanserina]|uniref:BTB domain-containing protein n=1 Tax=Podospora pseudoanserina TaxID=2609844 RepID=A0ABR0IIJ1_9PEZI|nr:hypothetical protein QC764_0041880 [Podospora pseudoanserina]